MDITTKNALLKYKNVKNDNNLLESQIVQLKKELDEMNILKSEKLKSYQLWSLVKAKELHECPRCKTRAYYTICPECDTARGRHIPSNLVEDAKETNQIIFKNNIEGY